MQVHSGICILRPVYTLLREWRTTSSGLPDIGTPEHGFSRCGSRDIYADGCLNMVKTIVIFGHELCD